MNPLYLRVIIAAVGLLAVVLTRVFSDTPLEVSEVVALLGATLTGVALPTPGQNGNNGNPGA